MSKRSCPYCPALNSDEPDYHDTDCPQYKPFVPDFNIDGPGIISVKSKEVVRTVNGRRQIAALERLTKKLNIGK